jgi:uncharacterized membrane protein YfcA
VARDAAAALTLAPADVAVLGAIAFLTAMLSGMLGVAGGMILLSVMLLYLEPAATIPLHAAIQLVSNGSRVVIQRRHIDWRIAGHYSVLLLPAGWLGLLLLLRLPPDTTTLLIGAFVLLATWRSSWLLLGTHPEAVRPGRRFLLLGGVVGALNPIVGATGPLVAPFFLNLGIARQAVVGTAAACQALGHLAKVLLFTGVAGFALVEHAPLLAGLSALVVLGTWCGSRLLDHVDERAFVWLYKTALTAIALRLILPEAGRLLRQAAALLA